VKKKDAKGAGDDASLEKTIAELFRAIEGLESSNKQQPGEGILAEARELAAQWKIKKRPLFEGLLGNNRLLLLAALVQALRRDHELLKWIRHYRPAEYEKLIEDHDRFWEVLADFARRARGPEPTSKQQYDRKYERKRRRWPRGDAGLIESEFRRWPGQFSLTNPLLDGLPSTCLDGIFAGDTVNMLRLQELFGMDRHRLSEALQREQAPVQLLGCCADHACLAKRKPPEETQATGQIPANAVAQRSRSSTPRAQWN
jgi:hypothetical protein